MRRFAFPFDALGKLRRRRREACELALAESRLRRDRQTAERAALLAERRDAAEAWRGSLPSRGAMNVAEAAAWRVYAGALERRQALLEHALARTEREMEDRRRTLLEAARSEKVVERLRERRHHAWRTAADREEQAFVNEAALAAFRRTAGGLS